jgi:flagellar L-ring protein precursor FlgH
MKTKFKFVFRSSVSRGVLVGLLWLPLLGAPRDAAAGSLWREAVTDERGMYADKKARRIGDIVTVEVDEVLDFTNTKTLNRGRNIEGATPGLLGQLANSLINSVSSDKSATAAGDPVRRKFPLNLLPKTKAEADKFNILDPANSNFKSDSEGGARNTQTIKFKMAVQVIDALPNGNLVIEGVKQIGFSNERQFISLRGIIRPTDILFGLKAATNVAPSILSRHIADARYEVVSEGLLSDAAKRGWLQRLDDKITPY